MTRLTVEEATRLQLDAADPRHPRMVNANAGSGKTKVLVDRVSRILLQGTAPDRILCITYTRAAASEMQERLYGKLSEWSVARDDVLRDALAKLYGVPFAKIRPPLDIDSVRSLFARALETPEGLKVMTIHAFCERIIARFPIEAGILPGFSPLDDSEGRDMLAESRTRLLEAAMEDEGLSEALSHMTKLKADSTLDALLYSVARDFDRTRDWAEAGGLDGFRRRAGLKPGQSEQDVAAAALAATDADRLKKIGEIARRVWKNSDGFLNTVEGVCKGAEPCETLRTYGSVFLTAAGDVRKRILVKGVHAEDDFLQLDGPEMRRVLTALALMNAARIADTTEAVLTLGKALGEDHARAKHQARRLDFNDLIVKTRDLLRRRDISDWIAYKMDGGVEHVLLDEAQDTSPTQWDIINAITDGFEQDSPDREAPPRTFFAVGDPKQSIYRFQGAAPSIFMDSVKTRGGAEGEVRLRMSFRSSQQVLDVVDTLFADCGGLEAMFGKENVPDASDLVRHDAYRDDVGLVELWPLAPKADPVEDRDPWDTTPVDAVREGDQKTRLARTIAEQIAYWIDTQEPVFDRDLKDDEYPKGQHRPMRAGDILILVQKRIGGLFDALIKALKEERLPVAGADRLVLQEATIVRDLLAITRFVLLPGDCLSLAEALKSPLFGLDDDQLFILCEDRGDQLLWDALQARAPGLAAHLQTIRDDAALPPYDFYARLLDRRNPDGLTYREALYRRLGMEAREALEAFLGTALAHQQRQAPSLLRFVQAFTADEIEIKRDKDPAGDEIRVMTVHGAKGLEAPVVFLPDTTRMPTKSSGNLVPDGEGGFILAPSGKESFPLADALKDADHQEDVREYMRLLYVAMTRAESRLILCGHAHGRVDGGFSEGSWYYWFQKAFSELESTTAFATPFDGEGRQGLFYGKRQSETATETEARGRSSKPLPDWIAKRAEPELDGLETVAPSALLRAARPVGNAPGGGGFLRGVLIHKLLEILPDHSPDRRRDLGAEIIGRYPDLDGPEQDAILGEVFSILDDPAFDHVFAHGSRAEVSLAGRVETLREGRVFVTAQVDRLSVTETDVYLIDYKSDGQVPVKAEGIDLSYIAQMAAYRELARSIWPDRVVRCGLLYTAAPTLLWLDDTAMDAVLTQVNALPTSGITETNNRGSS